MERRKQGRPLLNRTVQAQTCRGGSRAIRALRLAFVASAAALGATGVDARLCLQPQGEQRFEQPTGMVWAEPLQGWLVLEKRGRLLLYHPASGALSTVADWRGRVDASGEGGLLSLALDPDFARNRRVYTYMTVRKRRMTSLFERWVVETDNTIDPASAERILAVAQPYTNHNGGRIAFGPDGKLYIGLGDGGSAGDPLNHGQNRQTLLGSILRIDVRQRPYGIPSDNPFSGKPEKGRGEIYAWGLRNPWQFSFDPLSGDLWVADVGQDKMEEINVVVRGGNYGWRCFEGTARYRMDSRCRPARKPVIEYGRRLGQSVTGGVVYRGKRHKEWYGHYFYGDFASGRIWSFDTTQRLRHADKTWPAGKALYEGDKNIVAFAAGGEGELYLADFSGGMIYGLSPGRCEDRVGR